MVFEAAAKNEFVAGFTEMQEVGVEVRLKDGAKPIEVLGEGLHSDGNKRDVAIFRSNRDHRGLPGFVGRAGGCSSLINHGLLSG